MCSCHYPCHAASQSLSLTRQQAQIHKASLWVTLPLLNCDPALHLHLPLWANCYECSMHFQQSATKWSCAVWCYWMCICEVFLAHLVSHGAFLACCTWLATGCWGHAICQHELCLFEPWIVVVQSCDLVLDTCHCSMHCWDCVLSLQCPFYVSVTGARLVALSAKSLSSLMTLCL